MAIHTFCLRHMPDTKIAGYPLEKDKKYLCKINNQGESVWVRSVGLEFGSDPEGMFSADITLNNNSEINVIYHSNNSSYHAVYDQNGIEKSNVQAGGGGGPYGSRAFSLYDNDSFNILKTTEWSIELLNYNLSEESFESTRLFSWGINSGDFIYQYNTFGVVGNFRRSAVRLFGIENYENWDSQNNVTYNNTMENRGGFVVFDKSYLKYVYVNEPLISAVTNNNGTIGTQYLGNKGFNSMTLGEANYFTAGWSNYTINNNVVSKQKTNSGFISRYDFDEDKTYDIELILEPNKRVGLAPYDCELNCSLLIQIV